MKEIQIGDQSYRIGALDAFSQFHIARRIAPIQLALGVSFVGAQGELMEGGKIEGMFLQMMGPIITEVSKMPQADVDYVLNACLRITSRKQGDGWAPVLAPTGQMMFADIKMQQLVRICIEAIRENLGDFFGQGSDATA